MSLPMTTELWGTFSVKDHCRKKPFVADVILYDRLVIPFPADDDERQRWLDKKWDPSRQKDCLDILGNLAVPIPWNDARRQLFQERQALASDLDPFLNTSLMLKLELEMRVAKEFLPQGVAVRPVAAYPSRAAFEKRWSVHLRRQLGPAQPGPLNVVLGRKFLVPEDQALDDLKALEKVVQLARDPEFRQQRSNYHQWMEQVIREGLTEAAAIADMRRHVDACNRVIQQRCQRSRAKQAFLVTKVGLLAAAGAAAVGAMALPLLVPIVGNAMIALAEYAALGSRPDPQMPGASPAVMFYTAQKALGLQ